MASFTATKCIKVFTTQTIAYYITLQDAYTYHAGLTIIANPHLHYDMIS
jgi:hypothetical protein